jgi:hypothetical protein
MQLHGNNPPILSPLSHTLSKGKWSDMNIIDISEIEEMKNLLIETFVKNGKNLLHPDVLTISQKVDNLIVKFYSKA